MSCVLLGSGTYVYARPETSVTNHFSTGVVDINLDEYELTTNGGEEPFRDYTGKKGKNPLIMPGDDISKIPRITNDGNDCYVRAKLEFSGTDVDLEKELYGFPSGWEKHDDGYYYYKNILNTGDKIDKMCIRDRGFRAFMLNQPDTFHTGLHVSIQRKEIP